MTPAVSHGKTLFVVQTTHSAHFGTPFFLQGVTFLLNTVESNPQLKCKIKKNVTIKWLRVRAAAFSVVSTLTGDPCPSSGKTLKAVATLGHSYTSHVNIEVKAGD